MKKILLFSMMVSVFMISAFAPRQKNDSKIELLKQTTMWTPDKAHTSLKFTASHLIISDVDGTFKSFDGTMESAKPDFSDAKIMFTADVNSISTDNDKRDAHLKSDDFFNAAKYPQIKFVSSSFTPLGNNKYTLVGNLTIRDVTKTVNFDVKYGGTVNMYGIHAGFKATTKINRQDYNLKFSAKTEGGEMIVGNDIDITINVDFKRQ